MLFFDSVGLTAYSKDANNADFVFTYDSRGFRYDIPMYCIFEPKNLVVGMILEDEDTVANKLTNQSNGAEHEKISEIYDENVQWNGTNPRLCLLLNAAYLSLFAYDAYFVNSFLLRFCVFNCAVHICCFEF